MRQNRRLHLLMGILAAVLIGAAAFASFSGGAGKKGYPISGDTFLLDTFCSITLYEGGGEEALQAAMEALREYDALFDDKKEGSDLYRINHREGAESIDISPETEALLKLGREMCILSGGALEPAIRPVTSLWDFKNGTEPPEEEALKAALGKVKSLAYRAEDGRFTALDPELQIDVGAFAKGFIADRIGEVLREKGCSSAIINLGGNVLCVGGRPDGSEFVIGIRDPKGDGSKSVKTLNVRDGSVVTAGAYERCFFYEGKRWHHLLDPSTGYPAERGLESVTVTGPSSGICDALSTALFVKGYEDGAGFLKEFNEQTEGSYRAWYLFEDGRLEEA